MRGKEEEGRVGELASFQLFLCSQRPSSPQSDLFSTSPSSPDMATSTPEYELFLSQLKPSDLPPLPDLPLKLRRLAATHPSYAGGNKTEPFETSEESGTASMTSYKTFEVSANSTRRRTTGREGRRKRELELISFLLPFFALFAPSSASFL